MIRETWVEHVYTPSGFQIGEMDTVVDLGASIGVFTLFAALLCSRGSVVSYEPDPYSFNLLSRNIERNGLSNVEAHNAGVLDRHGAGLIWHDPHNAGGHSIYPLYIGNSAAEQVPTQFVTLEEVFEASNLEVVDLLKVDCEGAEYRIFQGATDETLLRVRRVVVECQPVPEPRVGRGLLASRFRSLGFRVRLQATKVDAGMLWAVQEVSKTKFHR